MTRRNIWLTGGIAGLVIVLGGVLFAMNNADKSANRPNTNEKAGTTLGQSSEQEKESAEQQQEELTVQPDINNEEFTLVGSNVNCSTTEVNGAVSRSCSGNIRIIPTGNESMNPGLYKINEQTKLLHDGQEQELTMLQELSQNQTVVRLTLAEGSEAMLAEIRY